MTDAFPPIPPERLREYEAEADRRLELAEYEIRERERQKRTGERLKPLLQPNSNGKNVPVDLLANLRNGAWLDSQNFDPLEYAIPGLIPEGLTLFVGPPKVGKSWAALDMSLALASGGAAFGTIWVPQRPVLYLALEDGERRMQDRCRKLLGDGQPIPPDFQFMVEIELDSVRATIDTWLTNYPVGLVIVDTLGKVMPEARPGESNYQRDYRIAADLKRLVDCRPGSGLLINHHDRKAHAEDFVDSVSGTHGLAGAADTIVVLGRRRHETDALIQVTGRDVAEGEYACTFTGGCHWGLCGTNLEEAAKAAQEKGMKQALGDVSIDVLDFINDHPEGVQLKEILDELEVDSKYVQRLHESGKIKKIKRGFYGPL